VKRFRPIGEVQAIEGVLDPLAAQTPYRFRHRLFSFETIGHDASPFHAFCRGVAEPA
jgi:hypothetical protein